jgi:dTDP-4-dehydrorhamnose reductase
MKNSQDTASNAIHIGTGPYGLVGRVLMSVYPDLIPIDVVEPPPEKKKTLGMDIAKTDITDPGQVSAALQAIAKAHPGRPMVLFHLAAMTDTRSDRTDLFERVNVDGTRNVLEACAAVGARMVHISTDYVFEAEGRSSEPYLEKERPAVCPKGAYAASKFRAENLVLDHPKGDLAVVARIAFPYGSAGVRPGLSEKILQRFSECREKKQAAKLFSDQITCPSYIPDIVEGLRLLSSRLEQERSGREIFHLVGERTTPYDFGRLIQKIFGYEDVTIESSSVAGMPYAANLGLSTQATSQNLGWHSTPHAVALEKQKASGGKV